MVNMFVWDIGQALGIGCRGCSLMWQVISIFYKRPVCCPFVDLGGLAGVGTGSGRHGGLYACRGQWVCGAVFAVLHVAPGTGMRMPVLLVTAV